VPRISRPPGPSVGRPPQDLTEGGPAVLLAGLPERVGRSRLTLSLWIAPPYAFHLALAVSVAVTYCDERG
jgi:hypothetical protein